MYSGSQRFRMPHSSEPDRECKYLTNEMGFACSFVRRCCARGHSQCVRAAEAQAVVVRSARGACRQAGAAPLVAQVQPMNPQDLIGQRCDELPIHHEEALARDTWQQGGASEAASERHGRSIVAVALQQVDSAQHVCGSSTVNVKYAKFVY